MEFIFKLLKLLEYFYECPRRKMVANPNSDLVKGVTFLKESI